MLIKTDIAHELGHMLTIELGEHKNVATCLSLLADTEGCSVDTPMRKPRQKPITEQLGFTRTFKSYADLGGLFGELCFNGNFRPHAVRYDLDSFLIANTKSKSVLIKEIRIWFRLDPKGFFTYMKEVTIDARQTPTISTEELKKTLPSLLRHYNMFIRHIDEVAFKESVEELYEAGQRVYKRRAVLQLTRRILL